jgi:lipoyl(octanoyl) transferase
MDYPRTRWRMLQTAPAAGAWNMAVDEAILERVGRSQADPTLRLYSWSPPCLSLGYAQPCGDVDLSQLSALGWQLVRRPTGGRAILHTDELTYSVCAPLNEPRLAGSVLESYHSLSMALLQALHLLGIPAEALQKDGNRPNGRDQNPVCFEVPSNYEITVRGLKLVGSAQARRREGVLQHGSLPLFGDLTRITQVLLFPDETSRSGAAVRLLDRATTVESVLPEKISWEKAAEAMILAFKDVLNLELYQDELSPEERVRAQELVQTKYDHPSWTYRI